MKVLLGIFSFVFLLNTNVFADSHKEAAYELIEAANLEKTINDAANIMLTMEIKNNPKLIPLEGVMREFFSKIMNIETLREDYAKIYMESFSESELRELTSFYKTAVGKKSLVEMPGIMRKSAKLGEQKVLENSDLLRAMITEEVTRLKLASQVNEIK